MIELPKHTYAKIHPITHNGDIYHMVFFCLGCFKEHTYTIKLSTENEDPIWTWNGSYDKPTFRESLITHKDRKTKTIACHLFTTDGMIEFCSDCTHHLNAKSVGLLDYSREEIMYRVMPASTREDNLVDEVSFYCFGCEDNHVVNVDPTNPKAWRWNEDCRIPESGQIIKHDGCEVCVVNGCLHYLKSTKHPEYINKHITMVPLQNVVIRHMYNQPIPVNISYG